MANVNMVILEGNLTQSAALSRWSNGTPYIRFTVASNEYYKKDDGSYESIPSFIDCQCKGSYAEVMAKHLLKGRHVTVTGRLKQSHWTDDSGQKHSTIFVKVSEISLAPSAGTAPRTDRQNKPEQDYQNKPKQEYDYQPPVEYSSPGNDYSDAGMFDNSEGISF